MPEKWPVIEYGKFRGTTAHYVVTHPDQPSRHEKRKVRVLAIRKKRHDARIARERLAKGRSK